MPPILIKVLLILGLASFGTAVSSFEEFEFNEWSLKPSLEIRIGLQHGDDMNFGLGALDDLSEKDRVNAELSVEPALYFEHPFSDGTFFGKTSLVAAANVVDGELSGQFARGGDSKIDWDELYIGWRNQSFSVSLGAQPLMIGDGFLIGDGNFDTGKNQGNFWVGPFDAFRNAAVASYNGQHIRGDAFWLRSDVDFGNSLLYGVNLENVDYPLGRYGFMFIEVYSGNALQYDGVKSLNFRALGVPMPYFEPLKFYTEVVWQSGTDDDNLGRDVDALAWYLDAVFNVPGMVWPTAITFRHSRFSGDKLDSTDSENYRPLFYGFGARGWDTFYQGEVAGEFHLFNSNQVTRFVKIHISPRPTYALTIYYYSHDLEERHYFGQRVSSRDWADEINAGIEYFGNGQVYLYAGIAWSTPHTGAREIFGDDDTTVLQTWMQFTF